MKFSSDVLEMWLEGTFIMKCIFFLNVFSLYVCTYCGNSQTSLKFKCGLPLRFPRHKIEAMSSFTGGES